MNKTIKKKWLEALKSGKFLKTVGKLYFRKRKKDRYCCLGVLCKVIDKDYEFPGNRETFDLPDFVKKESKLSVSKCRKLALLNDETKSFVAEVIPYIEKHL